MSADEVLHVEFDRARSLLIIHRDESGGVRVYTFHLGGDYLAALRRALGATEPSWISDFRGRIEALEAEKLSAWM